jgi:hypothetical protein
MSSQASEMLASEAYKDISKNFPSPPLRKNSELYAILVDEYLKKDETKTKSDMLLKFSNLLNSFPKEVRCSFIDLRSNKITFHEFLESKAVTNNEQNKILQPYIKAFKTWKVPTIPNDIDINQFDVYMNAILFNPELQKAGEPRRIFDKFHGKFPEVFEPVLDEISGFLKTPEEGFDKILVSFGIAFDKFAEGKGYSSDDIIKYKSALFFKAINYLSEGNESVNLLTQSYAQKTSGEFFAEPPKAVMTLEQYYTEIVEKKIQAKIKPLIGSVADSVSFQEAITALCTNDSVCQHLPPVFLNQLNEKAEECLQEHLRRLKTDSSVSSQPSIDNQPSTKLSNSKVTTGDKIFKGILAGLATVTISIGVALMVALLIGGLSFVLAPFFVPAVAAFFALAMVTMLTTFGMALLSDKTPQSDPKLSVNTSDTLTDTPADTRAEAVNDCTTSRILSNFPEGVVYNSKPTCHADSDADKSSNSVNSEPVSHEPEGLHINTGPKPKGS